MTTLYAILAAVAVVLMALYAAMRHARARGEAEALSDARSKADRKRDEAEGILAGPRDGRASDDVDRWVGE